MSIFSGIGSFFGMLFSPIGTVFNYVFFLPVFNVLMLIYQGVHSFGLAIILLTLLIRGSLYPLTRKQLASSRKMQELAPRLKEIQAQYRGDTQGMVAAQQALYKEHGVSMYGGCLPMLIQLPFLYALFYSFEKVLNTKGNVLATINDLIYPFLPHLTAAPDTNFLGLSLTTPNFALAVVAGVFTFAQMRMSLPVTPRSTGATDTTTQTAKTMQYIMPVFTIFIGSRFAAGLALYWTVSTLFSAVQQYLISGWGSLWVGVPGMERFVPKPKEPLSVTPPPTTGARRAGGTGAGATPTQEPPSGGLFSGLRESFRQIREQAATQATADRAAAEARRAESERVVEGSLVKEEAKAAGEAEERAERSRDKNVGGARDRKPRGSKSGAMLVRTQPGAGSSDVAPEKRVVQENSGDQPPADELPEQRIARESALVNESPNGVRTAGGNGTARSGAKGGTGKATGQSGQGGARSNKQQSARSRSRGSR